jgi:hypothetical protein
MAGWLANQPFRIFGNLAAINPDTGEPRMWWDLIQKERQRRGVGLATKDVATARNEMNRLGASVTESIEEQIARIDALLNEAASAPGRQSPVDLRIYALQVGCSVNNDQGGDQMEIETQIRGIDGVTIVKSLPETKRPLTPTTEYLVFELKFEILGAMNRVKFRDEILFPNLRRIPGINIVDWSAIHRTNVRGTVRTVRENTLKELRGGFGGGQGPVASAHQGETEALPTPSLSLTDVAEDWMAAGIQLYDAPMNANNMQYHVMVPAQELWKYASRIYRGDGNTFDAGYERFIQQGAQLPVYVAIGQNGRIKITGNEDLVWFAKKSGLKELPVFISYQKQA